MGHNTTVVFYNDDLNQLKTDPNIGEKIHAAILQTTLKGSGVDVDCSFGCGKAIENHHADAYAVVAVGNNDGEVLDTVWPYGDDELKLRVLKAVAANMGYYVAKKPAKVGDIRRRLGQSDEK